MYSTDLMNLCIYIAFYKSSANLDAWKKNINSWTKKALWQ